MKNSKFIFTILACVVNSLAYSIGQDLTGTYHCEGVRKIDKFKFSSELVITKMNDQYLTEYKLSNGEQSQGKLSSTKSPNSYIEQWSSKEQTGVTFWEQNNNDLIGSTAYVNNDDGQSMIATQICKIK